MVATGKHIRDVPRNLLVAINAPTLTAFNTSSFR